MSRPLERRPAITSWIAQIIVALILGQTLFFKFTGAPEARALFAELGVEPWGRIGAGLVELLTVILILVPRTAALGGALGALTMIGALGAHFTRLGVVVADDGGALFVMAIVTLVASLVVTVARRADLPVVGRALAEPQT